MACTKCNGTGSMGSGYLDCVYCDVAENKAREERMEARQATAASSVACVMHSTGCTEKQARMELEAEEGSIKEAAINLRAFMREGGAQ